MNNQNGSVAVVVALILTLLLGVMAFSMDAGYLYLKKNQYQNAVEAAAMAGALNLCSGDKNDIEEMIRKIAADNGLPLDMGALSIAFGFYDEADQYEDFSEFTDFVEEADIPSGEYLNAVRVGFTMAVTALTGMHSEVVIDARAVAYLLNFGMVALDEEGSIRIHSGAPGPIVFNGGIIAGRGDIEISSSSPPVDFSHVYLSAAGSVSGAADAEIIDVQDRLDNIHPIDDDRLQRLAANADTTLTPSDVGNHPALTRQQYPARSSSFSVVRALTGTGWGAPSTIDAYYIDLSQLNSGTTLFFDAQTTSGTLAIVQLGVPNSSTDPVRDVRLITNATLLLDTAVDSYDPANGEYYGGPEFDAVTFLTTKSVAVDCANLRLLGVNLMSGEDVEIRATSSSSVTTEVTFNAKALASGSISFVNEARFDWNFKHGFPCPPNVVLLGRLEAVQ